MGQNGRHTIYNTIQEEKQKKNEEEMLFGYGKLMAVLILTLIWSMGRQLSNQIKLSW